MEHTEDPNRHLENLQEIRTLMEKSSRFISLSGFSGVFVGIFALIGEYIAIDHFKISLVNNFFYDLNGQIGISYGDFRFFVIDAIVVLILSLSIATALTWRRTSRSGASMWNATTKRLLINMLFPLATGGIFCLALIYQGLYAFIAPATMIFYGLALFNASKYTLNDIRIIGGLEVLLGLMACFRLQYELLFWAIGFGLLHIIYGIVMYYKYER